jgi:DNA primase
MDNSLKEKVLQASDIVEVVGERVALKRAGREYVGLCPFHADHNPSMYVSPAKQIFKCWSCGAGGDVIRFIERFERVEFRDALAILAQRAGIDHQRHDHTPQNNQLRDALRSAVTWARDFFRRQLHETSAGAAALKYAEKRGLSADTIARHELGFAPDDYQALLGQATPTGLTPQALIDAGLVAVSEQGRQYDRFRNRLIFPIQDTQGRVIAFGGRALGDDRAKYLNSPETPLFNKSRVLYAMDLAREAMAQKREAIVVEGYMDAVVLHQAGYAHTVATLGTSLTDAHARLLQTRAATIFLCFDGDEAGLHAADRAVEVALRAQAQVRVAVLPPGEDPADIVLGRGIESFQDQLNRAQDALEFKWLQMVKAFGDESPQARRDATEAFLHFVAAASDAGRVDLLQQHLLIGRLSELLSIPGESVLNLLNQTKRRPAPRAAAGISADVSASALSVELNGVPTGVVAAVETLLGLLMTHSQSWTAVTDDLARALAHSQTWQRLYGLLLDVHEELGEYSIGDVVQRCDTDVLLEAVDRARGRIKSDVSVEDGMAAATEQLAAEMRSLRIAALQDELRQGGGEDEQRFQELFARVQEHHSPLPAESSG